VGRRLLAACELALGTPRVRLTLRPSNVGARRLYEEAGYVEIGTLQRYYLDGEDGLMMEKVIGHQ
jgi:ribosomal-protein-alanine N-acetyltransferase